MSGTVRIPAALLCGVLMLCVYGTASAITVQITQPANHAVFVKGESETFKGVIDDFGDSYAEYAWWIHEADEVEDLSGGLLQAPGPKYVEHGPWTFTTPSAAVDDAYTILAAAEKETPESAPVNLEFTTVVYTVVGLDIVPNPETKLTCVGLPQSFSANVQPAGVALTDYQWSIGGQRIRSYDIAADQSTASVTQLTEQDLQQPNVSFHWYDGGTAEVGLSAKYEGRSVSAEAQTWTVQEPTNVQFSLTPGPDSRIGIDNNGIISYGDPAGVPAMWFWFSGNSPTDFSGEFAFVQTINRNASAQDYGGRIGTFSTQGACWLDNVLPYLSQSEQAPKGQTAQGGLPDTPKITASAFSVVSDHIAFRTWLVFRPDGGTWVPLASGEWAAECAFHEDPGPPPHGVKDYGHLSATQPVSTLDYPVWPDRYANYPMHPDWVWVP
ncbi:MAG: hypothetical protein KBI47_17895 [Armatimonadetes bacterium]|nr:hypothetical protein [Armatimonadota bacterium]MDI9583914.1 hypothetical protein [Acidobacteriota bacterium]